MAKLKDVAKAADVSPATVSNALNNRKNVSRETKERILRLCKEMDYVPNPAGRSLKSGNTHTILVNLSDFDRQFYLELIHGISDYVDANNYDMIICTSRSYEKFMTHTLTCGSIIIDLRCSNDFLKKKAAGGYPIVTLDRELNVPNIRSVLVDNYTAEAELAEGLYTKGYRRFAFLAGPETDDTVTRYQALSDVLEKYGLFVQREDYYTGDFREKSGTRAAKLIMLARTLPDVLVCANDNMAVGAIRAFREGGIRVPEDIAVCGFDNTEMAKELRLTTVDIPNYERGYLAAQALIENVNGAMNFDTFQIATKVVWRTTTRGPA
jgi:LacI family transcriptional regulator